MMQFPISPLIWVDYLQQAAHSQRASPHTYVAVSEDGKTYQMMPQEKLKDAGYRFRKLSLTEIIDLSKYVFSQLQKDYESQPQKLDTYTFLYLSQQLFFSIEQLISAREIKRNQLSKQFTRGIGWTLSAATSVVLIGIPFYRALQKNSRKFEAENQSLRETIQTLQHSSTLIKELNQRLKQVPSVIDEAQMDIQIEDLKNFILMHIQQNMQNRAKHADCLFIFAEDIHRGVSFLRNDPLHKISDQAPIPCKKLDETQQLNSSIAALAALTQQEKDKAWESILQVAATQTSLTALFNSLKGVFVGRITSNSWMENQKHMALVFDFSKELPPIKLHILRHPTTQDIQEVKVELQASGDILKVKQGSHLDESIHLIAPHAIEAEMSYSIQLSPDRQPFIDQLSVRLCCTLCAEYDKPRPVSLLSSDLE